MPESMQVQRMERGPGTVTEDARQFFAIEHGMIGVLSPVIVAAILAPLFLRFELIALNKPLLSFSVITARIPRDVAPPIVGPRNHSIPSCGTVLYRFLYDVCWRS